ncbi:MAG: KH domain-containing protein [Clostridiales bacterium]|nr:KH domain-containing protein [Clostridiales bacterium]
MAELLEILAKYMVDEPDKVSVTKLENERGLLLELRVAPDDMGKVIGRQGRVARALRAVVKAAASATGERVSVEIMDQA